MPRGLVHVAGSERRVWHPGSPSSQTILDIRIRRGGISIQGPTVWAVSGSRTFTRFMDVAFSPLQQMRIRILNYLGDWLILAQAVLTSHKTLLLNHLGFLGLRVNFAKSILPLSQRVSFLGTVMCRWQQLSQWSEPRQFSASWLLSGKVPPVHSKLSRQFWALWQRLRRYFSWVCFTCDPSSPGWSRGFHPRLGVTDAKTMAEARSLSTRCLYSLKWSIFSAWCQDHDLDPVTSDVSVVLSFLQGMLDK